VLGVCMPGLMLQDAWRNAFFCHLRGAYAFANDLVWAIAQLALVGAVLVVHAGSTPAFILAWAGAANVAAVFGSVQSGFLPLPHHALRWFSRQRDLAPRYLVEFIARSAALAGAVYATAGFAGLSAAGALRGAQVVLGPLNILNSGVTSPAVAESVRISRRSPRRMLEAVTILGVVLVVTFVCWGVAMYLLPNSIGEALLKRSWNPAHSVILPYTAVMAASGMLTAATVGLRAMAAAKRSMRSRLITGVLSVVGGTVGAATFGAVGAALGLAAGLWIGGIQWWRQLAAAVSEEEDRRRVAAMSIDAAPEPDSAGV
jgi:O-antigen/teichoic acid export membrane protein